MFLSLCPSNRKYITWPVATNGKALPFAGVCDGALEARAPRDGGGRGGGVSVERAGLGEGAGREPTWALLSLRHTHAATSTIWITTPLFYSPLALLRVGEGVAGGVPEAETGEETGEEVGVLLMQSSPPPAADPPAALSVPTFLPVQVWLAGQQQQYGVPMPFVPMQFMSLPFAYAGAGRITDQSSTYYSNTYENNAQASAAGQQQPAFARQQMWWGYQWLCDHCFNIRTASPHAQTEHVLSAHPSNSLAHPSTHSV